MRERKLKAIMKKKQIPTGKLSGFSTEKEDTVTLFFLETNKKRKWL